MNARKELEDMLSDVPAKIVDYGAISYNDKDFQFDSHKEFLATLPLLDFDYNAGYGGQELFGTIVFTDNTWMTRGEYDGSEWWDYHTCPSREHVLHSPEDLPE